MMSVGTYKKMPKAIRKTLTSIIPSRTPKLLGSGRKVITKNPAK